MMKAFRKKVLSCCGGLQNRQPRKKVSSPVLKGSREQAAVTSEDGRPKQRSLSDPEDYEERVLPEDVQPRRSLSSSSSVSKDYEEEASFEDVQPKRELLSASSDLEESKKHEERVIFEDLSSGQEPFKVRVVSFGDGIPIPTNFTYITTLKFTPGVAPIAPQPCACKESCGRSTPCSCIALNGRDVYSDAGRLLKATQFVYECGQLCKCQTVGSCPTQVVQKGLKYGMEVFPTKKKGWGVRSTVYIPEGSFVCEYVGEVISNIEANKRARDNDTYMFELVMEDHQFGSSSDSHHVDQDTSLYTVDACRYGNLARFINHSCDPNLFVQYVLYDHHDRRIPHIMLFAGDDIPPYTELTYDYDYEIGSFTVNGEIQFQDCHCEAPYCRLRLW